MKKATKVLILLASLVLIVAALAVAVFAADGTEADTGTWQYTTSDGIAYTDDFDTAISSVNGMGTVTLLKDTVINASDVVANVTQAMTVDLGGHTLTVSQESKTAYISIATAAPVTFKNGTISAGTNNKYALSNSSVAVACTGHPIFRISAATNLTLDGINSYTASIAFNYGNNGAKITINGGDHYLMYSAYDVTAAAFVDSRANIDVTVNNARIIMTRGSLASLLSCKVTKGLEKKSTMTFNNCVCIASSTGSNLITYANQYTSFYFNGCDLYGAFKPTLSSYEASTNSANISGTSATEMTSANLVFGEGTRWSSDGSDTISPSCATGFGLYSSESAESYTFDAYQTNGTSIWYDASTQTIADATFATTKKTVTNTYPLAVESTAVYKYTKAGQTVTAEHVSGSFGLGDVISAADYGSTIYILRDVTEILSADISVSKNVTVDLGGNMYAFASTGQFNLALSSYITATFKNGRIGSYNANGSSVHPLFGMDASSSVLNLENVDFYGGSLAYSYNGQSPTVNVTNCELHRIVADDSGSGLFMFRVGSTVNVTDTDIYMSVAGLATIMSSYSTKQYSSNTHFASTLTFTNCNVISNNASMKLITNANNLTKIVFDRCYVVGSFDNAAHSWDTGYTNMGADGIILTNDTYIASGYSDTNGVLGVAGGHIFSDVSVTKDFVMNYASGSPLDGDFTIASSSKSYTFVKKAELDPTMNFIVTVGGVETYVSGTMDDALAAVDDGGTIKLIKDVSYEQGKTDLYKAVTIDLNGYKLTVNHTADNVVGFYVRSTKPFTIKNGTLDVDNNGLNKHFPAISVNSANAVINLADVTSFTGGLVYNYGSTGAVVNITGGAHHIIRACGHAEGGVLMSRANITLNANGSSFYIASGKMLINSLSYKQSGTRASTFNFTNCDVYSENVSENCIAMNEFTTVNFNACRLHTSIVPTLGDLDVSQDSTIGAAKAGSVRLGLGTVVSSACYFDGDAVAFADENYQKLYTPHTVTMVFGLYNGGTITSQTLTVTPAYAVGTVDGAVYQFYCNGELVLANGDYTLAQIFAAADAGSTVKLLDDIRVKTADGAAATVDKALTVDFDGHTVYVSQTSEKGTVEIATGAKVVFKNGTFVSTVSEDCDGAVDGTAYPLFTITTDGASLTLQNMTTYTATLIYAESASGAEVNIIEGEHHAAYTSAGASEALLDFRANATVSISDTTLYIAEGYLLLFAHTAENSETKGSALSVDGTSIIAKTAAQNILPYLNCYGRIGIVNSKIFGSVNPVAHPTLDTAISGPVSNSVLLGDSTAIADGATLSDGIVAADEGKTITSAAKDFGIALKISSGSVFDLENPTFTASITEKTYSYTRFVGELPSDEYKISWYTEDGKTVLKTEYLKLGSSVSAPTYTPGNNNGWYTTEFSGWTTTFGSNLAVDLSTYTVSGNAKFYPAKSSTSTPEAHLSAAQYNLSLVGSVQVNFYLPTAPAGVTVLGVYDENGNEIEGKRIYASGRYLYMYVIDTVGAVELTNDVFVTVNYNADGTDLTQTLNISPIKYAKGILADSASATPRHTAATYTLIADMIRYSNTLSLAARGTTVAELDELLEAYGTLCSELPATNDFAAQLTSTYSLLGHLSYITFDVSEYQPRWVLGFTKAMKITDVKVTLDGYYEVPTESGANYGELNYGVNTADSVYDGDYIITAYMESIPMYNIDRSITITVTTESGATYSGEYSLNAYYGHISTSGTALYNYEQFIKAFRAFGISSAGYRYSGGIIKEQTAPTDFFDCEHESTRSSSFSLTSGRYCSDCERYIFFYSDYVNNSGYGGTVYATRDEAVAGKDSAYSSVDYCHEMANNWQKKGYSVGCVAGEYTYYLGEALTYTGSTGRIDIYNDTSWNGAYFIFDDSPYDVDEATFNTSVFCLYGNGSKFADGSNFSNSGVNITSKFNATVGEVVLEAGAENIGFAPGVPMMIKLLDYSQRRYLRQGQNAGFAFQQEVILVDEYGNISNTTPVEWDYIYNSSYVNSSNVTVNSPSFRATAYPIDEAPITVSGLDSEGNINCTVETIVNNAITATAYIGCQRNILIRRANATVEGLDHIFNEDDTNVTPRQPYSGFINVSYAYNAVIKDMKVQQHISHYIKDADNITDKLPKNLLGSYEFAGGDSIFVTWQNCQVKNFFSEDGTIKYSGLFGTNRMRNMYLKDCFLNSFDAHSGAYNVTIEDSTFEHINFIGAGDIYMKNVTVYTTTSYKTAIILRQDYGATWRGNLYMDEIYIRYTANNAPAYVDLVRAYYTNHYFGYDTYLPINIYANNIVTQGYLRYDDNCVFENGTLEENIIATNVVPVGVHAYLNSVLVDGIDYSTVNENNADPKHCTEKVYITNVDAGILLPDHEFFENMKVYIDGEEQ